MPKLIIVESPAKAKTISKVLGRGYRVKASLGHVRDLPKSQFGVDIEHGFQPKYITIRGKGPVLEELRQAAREADRVYLATDPDREGEAISWHLAQVLNLSPDQAARIEFHEITERAIKAALQNPRPLDMNRVDAQQARRILDRLVGYKLSPLLWEKVKPGLSAGRVQSVALRLIVDREREIEAFRPQEYWTIQVDLSTAAGQSFVAEVIRHAGQKLALGRKEDVVPVVAELEKAEYTVTRVEERERRRYPAPPFTTSTLQQEASRRLGFSARRTMDIAQQLYEGLELGEEGAVGLITYMRTDSVRIAREAQEEAARYIRERLGDDYAPAQPPQYRNRPGAQAAHEAIRPTSVFRTPDSVKPYLKRDQYRLYRLIWERFVASQMAPAVYDQVVAEITAGTFTLRASGMVMKFPGFTAIYQESRAKEEADEIGGDGKADSDGATESGPAPNGAAEAESRNGRLSDSELPAEGEQLPPLKEGEKLILLAVRPEQHFTQPPPRYTEATLIKTLEEKGIGRPSTYAPILETIRQRDYVEMVDRRFRPTQLGIVVVDLLREYFPDIVDVGFTAQMESELDQIEEGKESWQAVVERFYRPFAANLARAQSLMQHVSLPEEATDVLCDVCRRPMVVRRGRYGKFLACTGFPECRHTKPLLKEVGTPCPRCGRPLVERHSRKGRVFYGCSGYPECDFTSWNRPAGLCPRCGGLMVVRGRQAAAICSNETCGYSGKPADTTVQLAVDSQPATPGPGQ
ncbi:MAG: type I DNA topoisomerase [Limnochordales bacterium]|nr:type I DNA topoisomerase [Limnochordales bacterium]